MQHTPHCAPRCGRPVSSVHECPKCPGKENICSGSFHSLLQCVGSGLVYPALQLCVVGTLDNTYFVSVPTTRASPPVGAETVTVEDARSPRHNCLSLCRRRRRRRCSAVSISHLSRTRATCVVLDSVPAAAEQTQNANWEFLYIDGV